MQFEVKGINKSINDIMRQIGYIPAYFQKEGEVSIVRQLTRNDYPRFHLYIKEIRDKQQETIGKTFIFSLHLDQKKPSYPARIGYAKGVADGEGWHAHSGEYDGQIVEDEAERIKQVLGI
ncbi:MAG: hypothetical protein A3C58_00740 [Candidatus Staskawiczbacteria bacterium RIFCSPHIGHO2_02_FULL_34_10]|uniref:Uncharacterized protein n=1 Tax=Candidatus Staskawiczbacteria bacterium RIFCSPHIGHO2_02_FULL_34_10 TaxID=1802205 RepID=A0A1G2HX31_9BACT|nr:MAG: hypothetical protein A3C58_00740 [Candidatus Staskawiczbacteria bacterium RIFCSPHIGHO2_02_FULL_34_10]